ncbi:DAO-domain-containing protein [Pluteus cervinus]|uniref:DAO-domain-containing protein n=1 Tax=Pluteus cervinus TaxID=181527 RepID=A0ACD3B189_9AGAR|nr:DAO-domain-containing protein [Pluteus cervinus]
MGGTLSRLPRAVRNRIIRLAIQLLSWYYPSVKALFQRINDTPGLPVSNPSTPYWLVPASPLARHGADAQLVSYADIVIIGSGITGTSFARTVLDYDVKHGDEDKTLQVVMLEARDLCSGATGRNGGHITPPLYHDYPKLVERYGSEMAAKVIRFRLSHLHELLGVAKEEGLLADSQAREVESFDVFGDQTVYDDLKKNLEIYQKGMPDESRDERVYEGAELLKSFQLSDKTVGCIATVGGAIHPYRFVTGILARLLRSYPTSFKIYAQTPCTSIFSPRREEKQLYHVITPKGTIRAKHIVHATNGWSGHLLPKMRGKIIPARGCMTAQTPRPGLGNAPPPTEGEEQSWSGKRSFVFYPDSHGYDYLTQQPASPVDRPSNYPPPEAELMLGGGFARTNYILTEMANADDRVWNPEVAEYLSGALASYFTVEGQSPKDKEDTKSVWTGVLGASVDERPWVGSMPESITERLRPISDTKHADHGPPPSEWIAAGYSGEGMVHAWMSAKALAYMVLGVDGEAPNANSNKRKKTRDWFPDIFRVTEQRWQIATVEDLIASILAK